MGTTFYRLQIYCQGSVKKSDVDKILSIHSNIDIEGPWILENVKESSDPYFDYINFYLDLIEDKIEDLIDLGIDREKISIFILYEYENQCNIEFKSADLLRLGSNNINLCVSCWQA